MGTNNKAIEDPTIRIKVQPTLGASVSAILPPGKYNSLRHSIRYQGGPWDLSLFVPATLVPITILREWFNAFLMHRLEEHYNGRATWQGVIWEMDLVSDGIKRRRSVGNVWNAVKCIYTLNTDQTQQETSYYTDTASISRYLRREFLVYEDNVTAAQAQASANDYLLRNSEPRPNLVGVGVEGEGLYITAVGDVATLNNLYSTATVAGTAQVGSFINTIISTDSAYVVPGRIATNTLVVEKEQRAPARVWDLILRLPMLGDGTTPYRVTVENGRLNYRPMDPAFIYEWRGLKTGLRKKRGPADTWDAVPGIMRDYTIPAGKPPIGSFMADRRDSLLDEVQMWQGATQISVITDDMEEDDLIQAMDNYVQMMTDFSLDPLHTPTREDA